jgi:O-acetyl-ADP-ribose deacetylase (regulator of RNase III)
MEIAIILGDITKIKADAIVNAANRSLLGGGGVDGAIHSAGGPAILEECKRIVAKQGGCLTGEAVITNAGNLDAKYIIHNVGPVWNGGVNSEAKKLKLCYLNSMQLALDNGCKSIAFPGISTGIYRYPKDQATKIAIDTVSEFSEANPDIERVNFVCFDDESYDTYLNTIGVF